MSRPACIPLSCLALALSAWLLALGPGNSEATSPWSKARLGAVVDRVSDGDTLRVTHGGRERHVRLIGIDTPEVYGEQECGGTSASISMRQMVQPGDRVRLVRDFSQDNVDHYGRLLRYVMYRGMDLGLRQLTRGWAKVYVFESRYRRFVAYSRAQRSAQRSRHGAWRLCKGRF